MSTGSQTTPATSSARVWDADLILGLFADPVRRGMILALARRGSLAPSQLKDVVGCNIDTSIKRLRAIRASGLVSRKADTIDQRREFLSLVPSVPVVTTEKGRRLDFSFLTVPLDGSPASSWDPDVVYKALRDPSRRKLLRLLFEKPSQAAAELQRKIGRKLDATLKHLVELRSAGFVVTQDDQRDGRRLVYLLAPGLPLQMTESGLTLELGFCSVRFEV